MFKPLLRLAAFTLILEGCAGDSLAPNTSTAAARGGAAASLWAVTLSDSKIQISWLDDQRSESGWELHRSTTGPTGSFVLRASLPANATRHDDSALVAGTEYCYKVRSFKTKGSSATYAAFTNTVCSRTHGPPSPPSGVTTVPDSMSTVVITWTLGAVGGEQRIERGPDVAGPWVAVATLPAGYNSYSDINTAAWERLVCYRIVATNQYGVATSDADCTALPWQPANVSASSADAQSIDVRWSDASNFEDGYEVQRSAGTGAWQSLATLAANAVAFHDGGAAPGIIYQYRVRGLRDGGSTGFTHSPNVATASRPPDAPVMVRASPDGSTRAVVLWSSESPLASEFRVERSSDGQSGWSSAFSVAPGIGNGYDVGRTPETQVCYRVVARNALGDSPPTSVDCTVPPARPTNLVIDFVDYGDGGVATVTWKDNSNVEDLYQVRAVRCFNGGCWYRYYDLPANPQNGEMGTTIGLEYYESIEGVYACADSGCSDPATDQPSSAASSPSATARAHQPSQALPRPPTRRRSQ